MIGPRLGNMRRVRWPSTRLALFVLALSSAAAGGRVQAQSLWQFTPYRVQLLLAFAPTPELSEPRQLEVAATIASRAESVVGAPWSFSLIGLNDDLRFAMLRRLADVAIDQLPLDSRREDKVLLLAIDTSRDGFRLRAREIDLVTQQAGAVRETTVAQAAELGDESFRLLLAVFSPLAQIESLAGKTAKLSWRAAALPLGDPSLAFVRPGLVLRPVVRTLNRDGTARRVDPIPWTYLLLPQSDDAATDTATLYSGVRGPLSGRRRGRTEQLALAVGHVEGPTLVELRSRTDEKKPLAGYDVYAYGPDRPQTELVGQTDPHGRVLIPPGPGGLRLLVIKHGQEFLARLPILPGLAPRLTALVPDDDQRLTAEGFIHSLQEELVDTIVRRQILLARLKLRIEEGKAAEADVLLDELRKLQTQQQFVFALDSQREKLHSDDPLAQRKIDKLFADTKQLLGQYLDPRELDQAELELNRARQAPAKPAPVAQAK